MKRHGNGAIVNMSSSYGNIGSPNSAIYGASKAAVRLFTKSTAIQNASFGIRANSVHPGPVNAPLIEEFLPFPEKIKMLESMVPMERLGQPDEIASAVLFLASDESSFMTGSELIIDGGINAR